jgi:MFS family permease
LAAVAVAFVANGLGGPSFLARLPERQSDLGLSDATLGLTLVGLAAGAMVASPLAGRWVGRAGSRSVLLVSAVGLGATLWTAGAAPNAPALFAALAVIGVADAAMDISMNANGAAFEDRAERSVMHGLHGTWSLGALGGAGIAAATAATGVSLTVHLALVGAALGAAVLAVRGGLVPGRPPEPVDDGDNGHDGHDSDGDDRGATSVAPHAPPIGSARTGRLARPLVVLAAATVAGAIIEGAPSDWSAIHLERLGVATGLSALGFGAFMAGMVGGRFAGDRLTDRFGATAVLRGGTTLVAAGLIFGVAIDHAVAFAVGVALAGLGASGFFPLAFSAAARTPSVSPGAGAATVSLAARVGFMVEPVLIGAVADLISLRWAFVLVAAVALLLAVTAPRIVPDRPDTARRARLPGGPTDVREP